MSWQARKAVKEQSKTKHGTRLVLMCIADYADTDGFANPAIATLSADAGMSDRQVQRGIAALIKIKELAIIQKGNGRGNSTVYQILLPIVKGDISGKNGHVKGDISGIERVTFPAVKGDIFDVKGDISGNIEHIERKELNNEQVLEPTIENDYGNLQAAVCLVTKKAILLLGKADETKIDKLFSAGYEAVQVETLYGKAGWWYKNHWKGKKGQPPNIGDIVDTIGGAVDGMATKKAKQPDEYAIYGNQGELIGHYRNGKTEYLPGVGLL